MSILSGPRIRHLAEPCRVADLQCNDWVWLDGEPMRISTVVPFEGQSRVLMSTVAGGGDWVTMPSDRPMTRCGSQGERIAIAPFDPQWCGPNSVDVHLGPMLKVYDMTDCCRVPDPVGGEWIAAIDPNDPPRTIDLPKVGGWNQWLLRPGIGYLGSIRERVECHAIVPYFDGRSSTGRLFVSLHQTAGRGDDGWGGFLTCEITVTHAILIEPGSRLGQFTFHTLEGERAPYKGRYSDQPAEPVPSRFHL